MSRRVRAPARQADAGGARIKEGPLPSPQKLGEAALQLALTSLGIGLTVGRPALQSRQSRFESGLPKNPNKRGQIRRQADRPLQSSLPGSRPEAKTATRQCSAFRRLFLESRGRFPNSGIAPHERSSFRTASRRHQRPHRGLLDSHDRAPNWRSSRYNHALGRARRVRRDRLP